MVSELVEAVRSLTSIMAEETARLEAPGRAADLAELATAKQRLVAYLEARTAELNRVDDAWLERLDEQERGELMAALAALKDASAPNAAVLQRHIELSRDMMEAITGEARRLTGTRHAVYGAAGGLSRIELPTPISLDSQF